jgi:hypothetical protein
MRKILLAAMIMCSAFSTGARAKNFAIPEKNPAATLSIPDSWTIENIEYGYSAKPSDGSLFFSVEYAAPSRVEKMLDNNSEWMKENHINPKGKPVEKEIEVGGLSAKLLHFEATDDEGDTLVDFLFIGGGNGRLIMLTLWGSDDELKANQADIEKIKSSIKAIN